MKKIIIGTRGSKLALYQAKLLQNILSGKFPQHKFEIKIIKTKGDKILDVPLSKIGDKGLFTKELELELLNGKVDLAVHSLKDIPSEFPAGLCLGSVLERADVRDVLISRNGKKLSELADGAVIGTSSLRRIAQLLKYNPKFKIKDIRGNVDTRLKKLDEDDYDAIIMAAAGIIRMGFSDRITEYLDYDTIIPACGQGAIATEIRENDDFIKDICKQINHTETYDSIIAERAFLRTMEGGCQLPVGCYTKIENNKMYITGFVSNLDGTDFLTEKTECRLADAETKATEIANSLLNRGGDKILEQIHENNEK